MNQISQLKIQSENQSRRKLSLQETLLLWHSAQLTQILSPWMSGADRSQARGEKWTRLRAGGAKPCARHRASKQQRLIPRPQRLLALPLRWSHWGSEAKEPAQISGVVNERENWVSSLDLLISACLLFSLKIPPCYCRQSSAFKDITVGWSLKKKNSKSNMSKSRNI